MVKTVNTPTEVMSVDRMAMRDVESGRMRYGVKEDNEMACESQSQTWIQKKGVSAKETQRMTYHTQKCCSRRSKLGVWTTVWWTQWAMWMCWPPWWCNWTVHMSTESSWMVEWLWRGHGHGPVYQRCELALNETDGDIMGHVVDRTDTMNKIERLVIMLMRGLRQQLECPCMPWRHENMCRWCE